MAWKQSKSGHIWRGVIIRGVSSTSALVWSPILRHLAWRWLGVMIGAEVESWIVGCIARTFSAARAGFRDVLLTSRITCSRGMPRSYKSLLDNKRLQLTVKWCYENHGIILHAIAVAFIVY